MMERKEFLRRGVFYLGGTILNILGQTHEVRKERLLRPPGFIAERSSICCDCSACCNACPSQLLEKLAHVEGPVLRAGKEGCSFCGLCAGACPHGVVTFNAAGEKNKIGAARIDRAKCLARNAGCFICLERCPEQALAMKPGIGLRVDHARCSGCGSCEAICPVGDGAIEVEPI